MDFAPVRYTKHWFAHLDIMGFSALVKGGCLDDVLDAYEEALAALDDKTSIHRDSGVSHTWFSDTFLIFIRGSSGRDFKLLGQVTRLFFQRLIFKRIPVRGAITYGDFYSQKARNLFVGPALVDSYKYGEDQSWIGLLLTPSAVERLEELPLNSEFKKYKKIPEKVMREMKCSGIRAYDFSGGNSSPEQNLLMDCLREMKANAPVDVQYKYQMAIDFAMLAHDEYYKTIGLA